MSSVLRALAVAAGFAAAAGPASAIVINDPAGEPRMLTLGAEHTSVVRLELDGGLQCSGSLISTTTVLTAKHCVDNNVGGVYAAARFDVDFVLGDGSLGDSRTVDAISILGSVPFDLIDGTDLALLTLTTPMLDFAPLRLFGEDPTDLTATMVGYGDHGVGSTGRLNDYDGRRRAATNVVDLYGEAAGTGGFGANIVNTDFDDPSGTSNTMSAWGSSPDMPTDEGTTAPGDSGGPLLVSMGSEWLIAGVLSGGTTANSIYGDISWWTGVISEQARSFIEGGGGVFAADVTVPLPAGGLLMLAGLAALGLVGRPARRPA